MHAIRRSVARALRYCCATLILVLTALVFVQVAFRFVRTPFDWAEEVTRYCFIWVSLLGAILGVDARAHFYVDVVPNLLGARQRQILDVSLRAIVVVFLAAVGAVSVRLAIVMGDQFSPVLGLPLSYIAVAVPIGLFGMCGFLLFSGMFADAEREPRGP